VCFDESTLFEMFKYGLTCGESVSVDSVGVGGHSSRSAKVGGGEHDKLTLFQLTFQFALRRRYSFGRNQHIQCEVTSLLYQFIG
jgi:hypothetical protein